MKFLVLLFASLGLLVSSVSGFSTYVTISEETKLIAYRSDPDSYLSAQSITPSSSFGWNQNYYYASLTNADLRDCVISNVSFRAVDFTGAVFDGATFSGSGTNNNLEQALFIDVSAQYVDFGVSSFWYSNFTGADLRFSDLSHTTNFDDSIFINTLMYGATLPDGYDQSYFESLGADFSIVPEPSTYALLLGGTVLGYTFWRRRQ